MGCRASTSDIRRYAPRNSQSTNRQLVPPQHGVPFKGLIRIVGANARMTRARSGRRRRQFRISSRCSPAVYGRHLPRKTTQPCRSTTTHPALSIDARRRGLYMAGDDALLQHGRLESCGRLASPPLRHGASARSTVTQQKFAPPARGTVSPKLPPRIRPDAHSSVR